MDSGNLHKEDAKLRVLKKHTRDLEEKINSYLYTEVRRRPASFRSQKVVIMNEANFLKANTT